MKTLSITFIAIALLLSACKKDSSGNTHGTYLLSRATYTLSETNGSTISLVDVYTYDDKNRVTAVNSQFAALNVKYTYNSDNQVSTAQWSYLGGGPDHTTTYTYSGNTVTGVSVFVAAYVTATRVYTLNSKEQIQSFADNQGSSSYTYDNNGNIADFVDNAKIHNTYTYDNKKNPLSMIGAQNIDLVYFVNNGRPETNVNNPLTSESGVTTYTYTYNTAGFPVTAHVLSSSPYIPSNYTVAYEYINK